MRNSIFLILISILLVPLKVRANVVFSTDKPVRVSQRQVSCNDSLHTDTLKRRPKVAVVLGGGGAKGSAHISVLREIEKAGIPIDIVVGTSMGAIVGGLYSCGYTTDYLDSIFRSQDWMTLFVDKANETELSYLARQRQSSYIFSMNLSGDGLKPKVLGTGLIKGKNIIKMFHRFTQVYPDSINFLTDLPITFACVTEDLRTGTEYIYTQGNLDNAIRSSMSIPGVFKPIEKDGMLLVDGGILNNYPVDVARNLGADIVIGSRVTDGVPSEINSMVDIINQFTFINSIKKDSINRANTDILIDVNTKGFTAASFTTTAIDSLLKRGEEASHRKQNQLKELGTQLGGNSDYLAQRQHYFETNLKPISEQVVETHYEPQAFPSDKLGVKINFNTYESASLLIEAYKRFNKLPIQVGATFRLGERLKIILDSYTLLGKSTYFKLAYEFGSYDFKFKEDGRKAANVDFSNHIFTASFVKDWRWAYWGGGFKYNFYHFSIPLTNDNIQYDYTDKLEGNVNYLEAFIMLRINTTKRTNYPTSGVDMQLMGNWYTGHDLSVEGKKNIFAASAFAKVYLPTSKRLCIIPSLYARMLNRSSHVYGIFNVVGGLWPGLYLDHHIPFYGIGNIEWYERHFASAMLETRVRISNKHYISIVGNAAAWSDQINDMFDEILVGYGTTYSYDSVIGPISLTLANSNFAQEFSVIFSIGHMF